ncbi:hypothetical protein GCM10009795_010630 [Nocardioides hankookensis]|uniref:Disulfide bond formation protein B n=1 Tax=Nocardioides hankookensis TaxID=443157 RepID=A0ABW1LHQ9_9ACTN
MQVLRALGLALLVGSTVVWSHTIRVDGQACGTVYDLWRGHWSPSSVPGQDSTRVCLAEANVPVVAANALLLLGVAALVVATLGLTRGALAERRGWWAEVAMASSWGVLVAALVASAALYLDPGPICPSIRAGGYDEYVHLAHELEKQGIGLGQCMVAGGGFDGIDYPFFAIVGFLVGLLVWVAITVSARLLLRRDVIRAEQADAPAV